MAYTAGDVIKVALQRILVQASEADLESDEYADALTALNVMMGAWKAQGIDLGYTDVSTTADTVTVPPGAIRAIIANLALEVAPDYAGKVQPSLTQQALEGLKAARLLAVRHIPTQYPDNLPQGTGGDGDLYDENFYETEDIDYYDYVVKDPDEVRPYSIDWTDLMTQKGDTISSSSWTADSGITVDSDSNTTLIATVVLSSGSDGNYYNVKNTIVTANSYTYERTLVVEVRNT